MVSSHTLAKLVLALGRGAPLPLHGSSPNPQYWWETEAARVSDPAGHGAAPRARSQRHQHGSDGLMARSSSDRRTKVPNPGYEANDKGRMGREAERHKESGGPRNGENQV